MTGIRDLQTMFGAVGQAQTARSSAAEARGAASANRPASENTAAGTTETIAVSSAAGALAQVSGTSDVRQEKVDSLEAAISSGSYNVSSAAVADKLLWLMKGRP